MTNKPLTDKKISEIYNHLAKNIDLKAAEGFANAADKVDWLSRHWADLENYSRWVKKYPVLENLTMSQEEQMDKVVKAYPDFDAISEPRMEYILNTNDFTKEELKDYYDFKKHVEDKRVAKADSNLAKLNVQAEQALRSKDSTGWGGYLNSIAGNEYARKHYIQGNPKQSVVNEIAGKAAGALDWVPLWSIAGPTIRTTQKWAADEPVLTPGTAADFAGGIIPDIAEKPARLMWTALKAKGEKYLPKLFDSNAAKYIERKFRQADNAKNAEKAAEDLKILEKNLDDLTDEQVMKLYDKANDPRLKKYIEDYWHTRGNLTEARQFGEMPNGLAEVVAQKEIPAAEQALISAERKADYNMTKLKPEFEIASGQKKGSTFTNGDFNSEYRDVPLSMISEHEASLIPPTGGQLLLENALKYGGRKVAGTTIGMRKWNEIDPTVEELTDKDLNKVISDYSGTWDWYNVPSNYDNPVIRAAYDKWKNETIKYRFKDWRR